jgi:His-Xaa-Ser system radical SAM maturase HxsC
MIDLRINIRGDLESTTPFVLKLEKSSHKECFEDHTGVFSKLEKEVIVFCKQGNFRLSLKNDDELDGDICIVFPTAKSLLRLIRANSSANTILLTEQCDQACIMCSQPPKNKIYDYYDLYHQALLLAPSNFIIGISGGEPTLEKRNLFPFLLNILKSRPDLRFHILTNGQHFSDEDIDFLKSISSSILWGVPVYSHDAQTHDEIVGKQGAYYKLLNGLNVLFKSGAAVEIRTVIMRQNYKNLPMLADFIAKHLPLCEIWALMQLENIGYAKLNWAHTFIDTSKKFASISNALSISRINNVNAQLYNFPKCTIPEEWQKYARKSISDWKNKYLSACDGCSLKSECCGFFEWYDEKKGFERIGAL